MPPIALGLVLASCGLHATWNLLIKRAQDKEAFTALYLLAGIVAYSPLFAVCVANHPVSSSGWLCVFGTGAVYVVYFLGLAAAYHRSDLSVAYPLARGIGPLLTVAGGVTLLGERPSTGGYSGIALLLAGVLAVGLSATGGRSGLLASVAAAAPVGVAYAAYSLIDKAAVARAGVHPAVYVYLTFSVAGAIIVPAMLRRRGRAAIRAEWRRSGGAAVVVGILNIGAYLLVLTAMALPDAPVAYIVPARTLSVLFGVWMGSGILGETGRAARTAGALLMVAGMCAVALSP